MVDAVPEVTRDIRCLPHQVQALYAPEPFVALVTGLGGGKTWTGARWIISRAVQYPAAVHVATGNSYRQLTDVVVPEIERALDELEIPHVFRKGDMVVHLELGGATSAILIRSTESVDKLRGIEIGSWWGDEVRDMAPYAVQVMLGRLRAKHVDQPSYLWTTTPKGFDHIWQRHVEDQDPRCRLIRAESSANPHLPEGYVDGLFRDYDEQLAAQELQGAFVNLGAGACYRSFDRNVHVIDDLEPVAGVPLVLSWDFGAESTVIVMQSIGREIRALREFHGPGVFELALEVHAVYREHRDPWHIYGDSAMGNARTASGRTWFALVKEALEGRNVQMRHGSSNPAVVDRINATNALMKSATGEVRYYVDSRCTRLIRDYERVTWREDGAGIDKKDRALTHFSDAADYYIFDEHRPSAFKSEPSWGHNRNRSRRRAGSR